MLESPDNLAAGSATITLIKCFDNDIRFIFIGYSNGQVDIFCTATLQKMYTAHSASCSHTKELGAVQDIHFESRIKKDFSFLAVLHKPICNEAKKCDETKATE